MIRAVRVLPEAVRVGTGTGTVLDDKDVVPGLGAETLLPEEREDELTMSQNKISLLQSQIGLLNNRLKEAAGRYDGLSERCDQMEYQLQNREKELQAEMQAKLDQERAGVVDKAKVEAAAILAEAKKIRAEAAEKGHAEGLEKGKADGLRKSEDDTRSAIAEIRAEYGARFSDLISALEKSQQEVEANLNSLVQLNEARLVRLWEGTLTTMLNREIKIDPDTTRRVLEGILERVSDKNRLLIYLSPSEIDKIQNDKDTLTDLLRGVRHLEFLQDPRVDPGSCIVETNLGIYDARWRTQMKQIEYQIADLYREIAKEAEITEDKPKPKRAPRTTKKTKPKEEETAE